MRYYEHPEHPGFIEAVRATPEDDLPRLIFADWLDEHGEADRAELIRVQVELARSPLQPYTTGEEIKRVASLRRRERELFSSNWGSWFAMPSLGDVGIASPSECELFYGFDDFRAVVRRGFVAEVRLPRLADWLGGVCQCVWPTEQDDGTIRPEPVPFQPPCQHCPGDGRTPGVGRRVVAEHPIEVVRVGDREPYEGAAGGDYAGKWWWLCGSGPLDNSSTSLPPDVWRSDRLSTASEVGGDPPLPAVGVPVGRRRPVLFDTRDAALAALSAALLALIAAWVKTEAGKAKVCPRCSGEGCSPHSVAVNGPCLSTGKSTPQERRHDRPL